MDARQALADALGAELDIDLTPEFVKSCDRVLVRLFLHGYLIKALPADTEADD